MKLLFDENLSPKLVEVLVEDYPESLHVQSAELGGATDHEIWEFAKDRGFAIVSKDSDFRERSVLESFPPKIVWLDVGIPGRQRSWSYFNVSARASNVSILKVTLHY